MSIRRGLESMLKRNGTDYTVLRDDEEIAEFKGIKSTDKSKIMFRGESDIKTGDWLRNEVSGEKFFVKDVETSTHKGKPLQKNIFYQTEEEHSRAGTEESGSKTLKVSNSPGSVIGWKNEDVSLENNLTWGDIYSQVEDKLSQDEAQEVKERLKELEALLQGDELEKGKLERFSDLLNKYSWLTAPIVQMLLQWGFS